MFSKEDLIKVTNAVVLRDYTDCNTKFEISTDTRTISSSDMYLPLKGETFDGEDFIQKAVDSGSKAYFTTKNIVCDDADLVLKVEDTKETYLKLAQYFRRIKNPKTIGVTGSSGKTGTKELLYSVLSQNFKTHKTFSNHNNEIGFCQTVLSMPEGTEVLIVEMGMRGLGEIELISTHLEPDIALITNSGSAHIGRLGSLDNIAIAKCEIAKGLKPTGIFVSKNQDIIKRHVDFGGEKIYYSLDDVKITDIRQGYTRYIYRGETFELNVEGEYNVENSLGVIEIALKLGMNFEQIRKGLLEYKPLEKRWEVEQIGNFKFINDSYNANPESMVASVRTFIQLYENPVVILGDMGELGEDSSLYHSQVGKILAKSSLNKKVKFLTVGNLAKKIGESLINNDFWVEYFSNNEEVSCYIVENLSAGDTIFLKASRSMKFEQILDNVKKEVVKL